MSMMGHVVDLNENETKDYKRFVSEMVYRVAVRSNYHPLGYGMYRPKIEVIEGRLVATWDSSDNCE